MGNLAITVEDIESYGDLAARAELKNEDLRKTLQNLTFEPTTPDELNHSFHRFEQPVPAFIYHKKYGSCRLFGWRNKLRVKSHADIMTESIKQYVAQKVNPMAKDTGDGKYFIVDSAYWVKDHLIEMVLPMKRLIVGFSKSGDEYKIKTLSNLEGNGICVGEIYTLEQFLTNVDADKDGREGWRMAKAAHLYQYPDHIDRFMQYTDRTKQSNIQARLFLGEKIEDIAQEHIGGWFDGNTLDQDLAGAEKAEIASMLIPCKIRWYDKLTTIHHPGDELKLTDDEYNEAAIARANYYNPATFIESRIGSNMSASELNYKHYYDK